MSNSIVTWVCKELGILKTKAVAIAPEVLHWAEKFLSGVTPIIMKIVTDAAMAAMTTPGGGAAREAAAIAAAAADLASQGIPFTASQIKAWVKIGYDSLPDEVKNNKVAQAIEAKIESEIDSLATKAEAAVSPEAVPAQEPVAPAPAEGAQATV